MNATDVPHNTVVVTYPVAWQAQMPPLVQTIMIYASAVTLLLFFVLAARQVRKYHTALPILYLIAGLCTVVLEPMACQLGQVFHSQVGQISVFSTLDLPIPWHDFLMYGFYFGGLPVLFFPKIVSRTLTGRDLLRSYLPFAVFQYLFEAIPVSTGLWHYYGNQALYVWHGTVPLYWALVGPAVALAPLALHYLIAPYLVGWRQLLVIPVNIAAATGTFFGVNAIWIVAANATWGETAVQLAGLASIVVAVSFVWVLSLLLDAKAAPKDTPMALHSPT